MSVSVKNVRDEIGEIRLDHVEKGLKILKLVTKNKLQLYDPRVMSNIVEATFGKGSTIRDLICG
jgi:hypothetical protein